MKNIGNRRIEIHDLELEKALDEILEGTELTYTFLRDVVVIKDRENYWKHSIELFRKPMKLNCCTTEKISLIYKQTYAYIIVHSSLQV